jgi:hypothetical protein
MGTRYTTTPAVGFGSSPPPDDGSQVAANLVTWAGVKTKLADPVHVQADAIDTKLVSTLDLSARAISGNDTAIASDHWKTLQVTGATTIQLSSAASMGAGYEVGVFNAGASTVTVTPAGSDTINLVSASVTVPIKGTMIFRTNQALTGYNIVGQSNSLQTLNQAIDISGTTAGQIVFPATQNASAGANTLDDYEEGTWIPSVGGTATYTTQAGQYTKIGRVVFISMQLTINAIGSGSTTNISGLPFTVGFNGGLSCGFFNLVATNIIAVYPQAVATGTTINCRSLAAAAAVPAANALFGNGTVIEIGGCYHV